MTVLATLVRALLDLVAPAVCAVCGTAPGGAPFCAPGVAVRGLRPWDEPALCCRCATIPGEPRCAHLAVGTDRHLPVWAAGATGPEIAHVIHAWKYHGQRGLAWPLAARLAGVVPNDGPVVLVPVPLHRRRRSRRGFNQAEMLARLVAVHCGLTTDAGILRRRRPTDQQARLPDAEARRRNMARAFAARGPRPGQDEPLLLVDDVVTSGATVAAAAEAATAAGWRVAGVLALATSLPPVRPVDRPGTGF